MKLSASSSTQLGIALCEVGVTFESISDPHLKSYQTRVSARPRVHEALPAEGLVK